MSAALLKASDLAARVLDDPTARVNADAQIEFLDAASKALNDNWLGFHLARDLDFRSAGRLFYVFASAARLGDGLERLQRYCRVTNEAVQITYSSSTESLDHDFVFGRLATPRSSPDRIHHDAVARIVSLIDGSPADPASGQLRTPPKP